MLFQWLFHWNCTFLCCVSWSKIHLHTFTKYKANFLENWPNFISLLQNHIIQFVQCQPSGVSNQHHGRTQSLKFGSLRHLEILTETLQTKVLALHALVIWVLLRKVSPRSLCHLKSQSRRFWGSGVLVFLLLKNLSSENKRVH